MSILFSLAMGRNTVCGAKRCLNAIEYNPDSIVIANCDAAIDRELFKQITGDAFETKIFINPIPRSPNLDANLLESHLRNYQYARDTGMKFTHIYFLSDQDMFFRKGLYKCISNYHAGFLMCSNFINSFNRETKFAEGEYINQKTEPFWRDGFLLDERIKRIMSEQIEGAFYCRPLFEKINQYIEDLPIHYTKIVKVHYEEVTFANIYVNLFQDEFPLHLPVSTIYRSNHIVFRDQHLVNIMAGEKQRESMPVQDAYESYHGYTFGIKRVKYHEDWDNRVKQLVEYTKGYLNANNISYDYLIP